ncbi:MAG: MarR family winged helix-turn-helix transcriptional regulator [Lachnospiraceae bacterium]
MDENNYCPCCGRHCDLREPHCDRGEEYVRTGTVMRHGHAQPRLKSILFTENYDAMQVNNKLIMNLRDLGHMIRFLFEGKGSQKRILIILRETGGMTQRELTERIGVKPGSASEVIGKLENAGFIERTPSQADRRTVNIRLTESGQVQAEEAARQREIRHQEMFACLSEEERNTLLALLEKLNADWDKRYRENGKEFGHSERCGNHHRFHEHPDGQTPREHYDHQHYHTQQGDF